MDLMQCLSVSAAISLVLGTGTVSAHAADVEVDIKLVLAGDVSSSMDDDERRMQRDGFAAAFRHPDLMLAIGSGATGRVAVTYVEWAGPAERWIIAPWTIIADRHGAEAFADLLATTPIVKGSLTSMSHGLLFAAEQFRTSGAQAYRETIDISGDGPNNVGPQIDAVRDWILSQGITINGLALATSSLNGEYGPFSYLFYRDEFRLDLYYEDCVIGGAGAFVMSVSDPSRFMAAIRRKLMLEIASVPARFVPIAYVERAAPASECLIDDLAEPH